MEFSCLEEFENLSFITSSVTQRSADMHKSWKLWEPEFRGKNPTVLRKTTVLRQIGCHKRITKIRPGKNPAFLTSRAEHNKITSVNLSTFTNPEKYPVSRVFPS